MVKGIQPTDNSNLMISQDELQEFLDDPIAAQYVRPFYGAKELVTSKRRWCLWMEDLNPQDIHKSSLLAQRITANKEWRSAQKVTGDAYKLKDSPAIMRPSKDMPRVDYLGIPRHTSEHRLYLPVKYFDKDVVCGDANSTAEDPDAFVFGIISSLMLMAWQKAVGGRIKSDIRFSNNLVWNNLPLPPINEKLRLQIIETGQNILVVREAISARTGKPQSLADLYNPLVMDKNLLDAHKKLDRLVDKAFGSSKLCTSEVQRQEILFARYSELTN
ncbi:type IIL restriction-modification enzyme MmeI [Microbacterium foliorum]|uniref:type IIL restriction-modification enzyme MmeI n=1 Tax=Rothia terrae TaxID=396015 RepID=UPI0034401C38